jgi:hypothetical protein
MGWLVETEHLASEESDSNLEEEWIKQKQEEERVCEDLDLLSYIDKLCSEDFIGRWAVCGALVTARF